MDYKDITSELCLKCGECCRVTIPIHVDNRYFEFLKTMGYNLAMDEENPGQCMIDTGYCIHLDVSDGLYKCSIYNDRPQLCRDYNCLAWASFSNMKEKSKLLAKATKLFYEMRTNSSDND